jgi:hypothetical protein
MYTYAPLHNRKQLQRASWAAAVSDGRQEHVQESSFAAIMKNQPLALHGAYAGKLTLNRHLLRPVRTERGQTD